MIKTEKEKMIQGLYYDASDDELVDARYHANQICHQFNQQVLHESEVSILKDLLDTKGHFLIKPPFMCDYGFNIHLEEDVMINYNCTFLDVCPITIKKHTLIGPSTQLYTAAHPLLPHLRQQDLEYGKPITIGENVWIGGNCVILPGITIGNHSVIGAGSVVTKDIPDYVVAAGNPCKVLYPLPLLESKRLMMRKLQKEDEKVLYEILSDEQSCMDDGGYAAYDENTYPPVFHYLLDSKEHFALVLKEKKQCIGLIHVMKNPMQLGYIIHPKYRNQGYGKEALKMLSQQIDEEIICTCFDYNLASMRILEENNFIYFDEVSYNHPQKGEIKMLYYKKKETYDRK